MNSHSHLKPDAKNRMMLSRETLEGLQITGRVDTHTHTHMLTHTHTHTHFFCTTTVRSFVEITKYLLSEGKDLFILSERVSQDPLENYFGKQRARGGRNENPTVQQCVHNQLHCVYRNPKLLTLLEVIVVGRDGSFMMSLHRLITLLSQNVNVHISDTSLLHRFLL